MFELLAPNIWESRHLHRPLDHSSFQRKLPQSERIHATKQGVNSDPTIRNHNQNPMGFVLGNSKSKHLLFLKGGLHGEILSYNIPWKFHIILTQVEWWISQFPTLQKNCLIFIFGYPEPRPCRRYPPHLGAVDPPHLGGVQSGPRCRSRPLPRRFFTQAANIFTRMRWMFRKPTKKHTVVYVKKLQQQYLDGNKIQIHISVCFVKDWHGSC